MNTSFPPGSMVIWSGHLKITLKLNSCQHDAFLGKRSQVDDVTPSALNKSPIRLHYILSDFAFSTKIGVHPAPSTGLPQAPAPGAIPAYHQQVLVTWENILVETLQKVPTHRRVGLASSKGRPRPAQTLTATTTACSSTSTTTALLTTSALPITLTSSSFSLF